MTVGTHSLRKTGFLFAIFGIQNQYIDSGKRPFCQTTRKIQPIEDVALLKSARHHEKTDTSPYHQDALTLYADLKRQPNMLKLNKVSSWEPIWVEDVNFRRNMDESTSTDMNIVEVATFFVEKELRINVSKSSFDGIILAATAQEKKVGMEEEFMQLTVDVPEYKKNRLWEMTQRSVITILHVPASSDMDLGKNKYMSLHPSFCQDTDFWFISFQMPTKKRTTKETTETMPRRGRRRGKGRYTALSATISTGMS